MTQERYDLPHLQRIAAILDGIPGDTDLPHAILALEDALVCCVVALQTGVTLARARDDGEVKTSHPESEASTVAVQNLHRVPLAMAKAQLGAAVNAAIGTGPRKAYGHEGLIAGVCAGPKVPDYLARIYQDPDARRRLGLALLKGDPKVKVRVVVEIEEG